MSILGYNSLSDVLKGYTNGALKKHKRGLSDRSHLTIEFPQSKDRVIRTFVPFLQNPSISEKGKANLNTYNLVGRAGQLFSYGGAESRKLNVSFSISLLHVLEEEPEMDNMFRPNLKVFFSDNENSKVAFNLSTGEGRLDTDAEIAASMGGTTKDFTTEEIQSFYRAFADEENQGVARDEIGDADVERSVGRNHAALQRAYYDEHVRKITGLGRNEFLDNLLNSVKRAFDQPEFNAEANVAKLDSTINLVYFWLNLIRGSVLNRSDNTMYGPPIVRLTHGAMYNNVPCLLQDYSINIDEQAGHDVATLTPKKIDITLNLVESRTGNFGNFQSGEVEFGDNITGWESVIEENNMDPCNGVIGQPDQFGSGLQ
jgi:hypothetical protein